MIAKFSYLPRLPGAAMLALALLAAAPYCLAMEGEDHAPIGHPEPASWPGDRLTISNLGHATLLMNYYGVRVISDPTLMDRVGFSVGSLFTIGPERHTPPPLGAAELRNLDVVLVTHAHMDHLDIASLAAMPKTAVVIACDKCANLIAPLGFTVLEKDGHRMLLACDSADTDLFASLAGDPPEVAAFSIGAYNPWIWNHANPEQVWSMFLSTHARYLVPIHWGTFKLSKEPMDEPMSRLIAAAGSEANRIVLRHIGGTWSPPEELRQAAGPAPRAAAGSSGGGGR
jgi:L-ascorbate metabolism protein UlaG (beta-lactamase superfamily)